MHCSSPCQTTPCVQTIALPVTILFGVRLNSLVLRKQLLGVQTVYLIANFQPSEATQCSRKQCSGTQCSRTQCSRTHCSRTHATEHNATEHNAAEHIAAEHNAAEHIAAEHNAAEHNATEHNGAELPVSPSCSTVH